MLEVTRNRCFGIKKVLNLYDGWQFGKLFEESSRGYTLSNISRRKQHEHRR